MQLLIERYFEWMEDLYMSKDGSIWQFFVLCLLGLGGHAPSATFYYSSGHPWKGKIAKWSSAPASTLEGLN